MVEAASPVQTAGLGLPVVAAAARASRTTVAEASRKGAIRSGRTARADPDAYLGRAGPGGVMRSRAIFKRHCRRWSIRWCSALGM
ncbi:MAG TPA: hypothetical protein VNF91_03300 [Candidatus Acidoferrum sp.]|nr:hypothetical protein [Candidatus Acidoferrum sp.]